jgi:carbonic anhydrase/acetyltransferase-like protein (isoleucine patch superfamily)
MAIRSYQGVTPTLGQRVYLDEACVVVGQVILGDDVSVWPFALLRGDVNTISVGARTNIQDGCLLHGVHDGPYSPGGFSVSVGADVTLGHRAIVHAAQVGARCLIGMSAVVLDGAVIEDEVIVAAGSLVPPGKRLSRRGLYLGNPVKRIRELGDAEIEQLLYGAAHYVRLKNNYLID